MMNNHYDYDAPKGFCDRHGIGYIKAVGCLDCLGMQKETKAAVSNTMINDAVSVRIFPSSELAHMIHNMELVHLRTADFGNVILPNNAYLLTEKSTTNLLYFKLNDEQAIEITILVQETL